MATDIRDRRVLPALVAVVVAAFLVIPMVTSAPMVRAQSQEQEDPCEGVPRSTFEDRNEADEVHRRSIDCVDFYDISSGDASGRYFRPNRQVTRGQMATFIINTLEAAGLGGRLPHGDPPDEFSDIAGDTHRTNINRLARIGVVQGSNGRYRPEDLVRRDQMATFLLQAKEWAYQEDYETSQSYFSDVPPSNVHFGNINAAYEEQLVRGTSEPQQGVPNSGTYAPGRNVRRQNMASFLTNALRQVDAAPDQWCAESSPSPTSSPSASPTPTATPTSGGGGGGILDPILNPSPTASPSPTATASPTETTSPTTEPSPTESPCANPTGSPGPSPSPTASPTATSSPSPSPSATPTSGGEDCQFPIDPLGFCPSPSPSPSPTSGGGLGGLVPGLP
jgi:hypothetical protein